MSANQPQPGQQPRPVGPSPKAIAQDLLTRTVEALNQDPDVLDLNGSNLVIMLAFGMLSGTKISINLLDDDDKSALQQVIGIATDKHLVWTTAQIVREEVKYDEGAGAGQTLSGADLEEAMSSFDPEDLEGDGGVAI